MSMEPLHSIEYEVTSEFATEIQRTMMHWEIRRGWKRDVYVLLGALFFGSVIVGLGLAGWVLPAVAGGLLCLVMLFVIGAIARRWSVSRGAAMTILLALQAADRRVRIEFNDERVRLETDYFRGEGAWSELDEVVFFATFCLLSLTNGGQILIPNRFLSPELEAFIRAKAQLVSAPVRRG